MSPVTSQEIRIIKGEVIEFEVEGTDTDADIASLEWSVNNEIITTDVGSGGSFTFTHTITFDEVGTFNLKAQCIDNEGNTSTPVRWTIKPVEKRRKMYVDSSNEIIGDETKENTLLTFAQENNITELYMYWVNRVFWYGDTAGTYSLVDSFIGKAKNDYGIEKIIMPIGGTGEMEEYVEYYNSPDVTNKYDGFITEIEYWGDAEGTAARAAGFESFKEVLAAMNEESDAAGGLSVEVYIGWVTESEMQDIVSLVDVVNIHSYSAYIDALYNYTSTRLEYLLNSADANSVDVNPIFSKEPNFSDDATLDELDGSWYNSLKNDTDLENRYASGITGALYFTYKYMDTSNITLSIDNIESSSTIKLYPNPSNDIVNITLEDTDVKIKVFSKMGNFINIPFDENRSSLDFSGFSSGMYFIEVTNASNNTHQVLKFIKN